MRELCNARIRPLPRARPTVPARDAGIRLYRHTFRQLDEVLRTVETTSAFESRIFRDFCLVARANSELG